MSIENENDSISGESTWVGVAYVIPEKGSFHGRRGLLGGYGFVTFRNSSLSEGVKALANELSEGGTQVVGFEWLSRLEDNERELTVLDQDLINKLAEYPIQFQEIHWFAQE